MQFTVRRMMVAVTLVALISSVVAYLDRSRRQARQQSLSAIYLKKSTLHKYSAEDHQWTLRNRIKGVSASLSAARRARQWRPVAIDPEAERQALRSEGWAEWSLASARTHWAMAAYHWQMAKKYETAASRPLEPISPDPPPPPLPADGIFIVGDGPPPEVERRRHRSGPS